MSIASARAATLSLMLCAAPSLAQSLSPRAPRRYVDRGRVVRVEFDGSQRDDDGRHLDGAWVRDGRHRFHAFVGPEAIAQLAPGADVDATLRPHGARAVRALMPSIGLWLVRDAREGVSGAELAERLSSEGVARVVPDLYLPRTAQRINVPPNDPRYPGQWFLGRIGIEPAWRRVSGDRGTTIVVVDNGCQTDHPDLAANMLPGRDVLSHDDDPTPVATGNGANHGTACAGLVAAATDNGVGVAGVCPECTLRCVRLLAGGGMPVPISADVEAMNFARDTNAAVVSNSWGFTEALPVPGPLATAMEDLFDHGRDGRGTLVVFAAGNDDREVSDDELFGVRGVVTVGAINNFDEAAQFSNFGAALDLTAPTGTLTTDLMGAAGDNPGDYTSTFGGTSSACPLVAGVAGLLFSARPESSAREVSDALIGSARAAPFAQPDDTGHDPHYGYGVVDPTSALRRLFGEPDPADAGADAGGDGGGDAGVDASGDGTTADVHDAGSAAPTPSGCACRAVRGDARGQAAVVWAAVACAVMVRRRRRARAPWLIGG